MEQDKIFEETLVMQMFRESFEAFPKGKLRKSESPDFILRQAHKESTGIELTRLNDGSDNTREDDTQICKKNLLVELCREKLQFQFKQALYVKIFFKAGKDFEEDPGFYADFITLYISKSLEKLQANKPCVIKHDDNLPDFLEAIGIIYHPTLKSSNWSAAKNFLIYDLTPEILQQTLNRKEEKLQAYRKNKLDQYWLIISTLQINFHKNYNFANKLANWKFESSFDKVFLFDVFETKSYELNI